MCVYVVQTDVTYTCIQLFGKMPSLRLIVAALARCVYPLVSAFLVLIIFIAVCECL